MVNSSVVTAFHMEFMVHMNSYFFIIKCCCFAFNCDFAPKFMNII